MNTVCDCSHDDGLFEKHSQNVWSDRDQTVTVTCSHGVETVEFRYGFKLLRLAFRFQTVTVSHFFRPCETVSCERNQVSCERNL